MFQICDNAVKRRNELRLDFYLELWAFRPCNWKYGSTILPSRKGMIFSSRMAIHKQGARLVDDSRTFDADELTEIWAWLDSFDAQPVGAREQARLQRPPLVFHQDQYVYRERIFSVAKCSDGRELLGSIIGVVPRNTLSPVQLLLNQPRSF